MTRDDLEFVPEEVNSGRISWKQAINDLIIFIIRNKPMFGLMKFDEDFMSEVIVGFLDRGEASLSTFERSKGTFFNYLFCFITNICNSVKKARATRNVLDYISFSVGIDDYKSKVDAYSNIKYDDFERPKIPYKYTPVSYKDFQIACKTNSYHIRRIINKEETDFARIIKEKLKDYSPTMIQNIIMVLALKSSYYITEDQIEAITQVFDIDSSKFHQIIQEINRQIEPRKKSRYVLEERRNRAYLQRKKLYSQIEWNGMINKDKEYPTLVLKKQYQKNTIYWKNLNNQLEKGKIFIRPTTKLIAQVLGISDRQVTYYQTTARKLGIDLESKEEKKEKESDTRKNESDVNENTSEV